MSTLAAFSELVTRRGEEVVGDVVAATKAAGQEAARQVKATGRHIKLKGRNGRKVPLGAKSSTVKVFPRGARPANPRDYNAVVQVAGDPVGFWSITVHGRRGGYVVRPKGYGGSLRGLRGRDRKQAMFDQAFGAAGQYRGLRPLRTPFGPRFTVTPGAARPINSGLWRQAVDSAAKSTSAVYNRELGAAILRAGRNPKVVTVKR